MSNTLKTINALASNLPSKEFTVVNKLIKKREFEDLSDFLENVKRKYIKDKTTCPTLDFENICLLKLEVDNYLTQIECYD